MRNATTSTRCCVCGASEARPWRTSGDNLLGGDRTWRAVRCVRCGTARLDPRPPITTMGRFYSEDTYARAEDREAASEVAKRLDAFNLRLARRADEAARNGPHPRVLDVGCGDGRFLHQMAQSGWTVEGLETDAQAAALARRRLGATIHEAPLETLELQAASFDLVSLLHVLEHVPDPPATLRAARRVLRPGGTLLLALPNVRSLEAGLFGAAWYHLDLPRHLWGFTPHTLTRLVEQSGFAPVSLRYLPFLFAPQSVRNRVRRSRPAVGTGGSRASGGALQTWVFRSLLAVSERVGRTLPGEIMEMTAVRGS